jgi:alpha-tubulin suppressor-like RCC1 family protein
MPRHLPRRCRTTLLAALAASATLAALCAAMAPAGAAPDGSPPSTTSIVSWGENNFGQLGYNTGNQSLPHNVVPAARGACDAANMRSIKQISAGAWSSMALLSDGVVCSWGRNLFGELGQGTVGGSTDIPGPVCAPYSTVRPCSQLLHASAIATGGLFGMAIVRGVYRPNPRVALRGAVVTFGSAMTGELGQGRPFRDTDVPKLVCTIVPIPTTGPNCPRTDTPASKFLRGATQISAGEYNAMALVGGHAAGWGDNSYCQLGVGPDCTLGLPRQTGRGPYVGPGNCDVYYTESFTNCSPDPVRALTGPGAPISGVTAVSVGNSLSEVLLSTGRVMTYGGNGQEALGDGVSGPGLPHTCYNAHIALTTSCGWYAGYVVGSLNERSPCYSAKYLSGVIAISAGFPDTLALLKDGDVCDWGTGTTYGNLGDGALNASDRPVAVCAFAGPCSLITGPFLTGVTAISAGLGANNLALVGRAAPATTVVTWGNGQYGEQGQNTTSNVNPPRRVCRTAACPAGPYLTGMRLISAGGFQDLASP